MPKQTFKIEGFHGGLNTNADPRDISELESASLKDVAIDKVGKLSTIGAISTDTTHSNTLAILDNYGLFTMNSDIQLERFW